MVVQGVRGAEAGGVRSARVNEVHERRDEREGEGSRVKEKSDLRVDLRSAAHP